MQKKIIKAVIPAAGMGTRMLPITKVVPKELIPVRWKPMIQYAVEESIASGIKEIALVINRDKELIRRYFESPAKKVFSSNIAVKNLSKIKSSCKLHFIYRERYRGLADAILGTKRFIDNQPFALILPDNIFFSKVPATKQVMDGFYKEGTYTVGLMRISKAESKNFFDVGRVRYRKVKGKMYGIARLFPKRKVSFPIGNRRWAVKTVARTILLPDFFDYIDWLKRRAKGDLDDVPIYQRLVDEGRVVGRLIEGKCFDVGNFKGLCSAIEFLYRNR